MYYQVFLTLFVLGTAGSGSQVICTNTNPAVLGGDVTLTCEFEAHLDVLQVTWQKKKGKETQNMVTLSEKYGINIARPFEKLITVLKASSTTSSIKLSKLEKEDEACYVCLFNAYPSGTYTGEVCLTDLRPPPETEPPKREINVNVLGENGVDKDDPEIHKARSRVWLGISLVGAPLLVMVIFFLIHRKARRMTETTPPSELDKAETGQATPTHSIHGESSGADSSPECLPIEESGPVTPPSHVIKVEGAPSPGESQGSSIKRSKRKKVVDSTSIPMSPYLEESKV